MHLKTALLAMIVYALVHTCCVIFFDLPKTAILVCTTLPQAPAEQEHCLERAMRFAEKPETQLTLGSALVRLYRKSDNQTGLVSLAPYFADRLGHLMAHSAYHDFTYPTHLQDEYIEEQIVVLAAMLQNDFPTGRAALLGLGRNQRNVAVLDNPLFQQLILPAYLAHPEWSIATDLAGLIEQTFIDVHPSPGLLSNLIDRAVERGENANLIDRLHWRLGEILKVGQHDSSSFLEASIDIAASMVSEAHASVAAGLAVRAYAWAAEQQAWRQLVDISPHTFLLTATILKALPDHELRKHLDDILAAFKQAAGGQMDKQRKTACLDILMKTLLSIEGSTPLPMINERLNAALCSFTQDHGALANRACNEVAAGTP